MQAICIQTPGAPQVLHLGEAPAPTLTPHSLRIQVHATAVNRADTLQRRGLYAPPQGASPILGLECAGQVLECGSEVTGWQVGQRAMALLSGGGYAEEVVVHAGSALPIPPAMTFEQAAAFPESMFTAFLNLFMLGEPPPNGAVLIHGGGSGLGTAALALCREAKLTAYVTAGSAAKCAACLDLGAHAAINYREEDFAAVIQARTQGQGVHVVLDSIGAPYLEQNLKSLAHSGRLISIGLMAGHEAPLNMRLMLSRNLRIIASTLRGRPVAEKAHIIQTFRSRFGAALEAGRLTPVVDRTFPLAQASEAHALMEGSTHFGKIVLRVR